MTLLIRSHAYFQLISLICLHPYRYGVHQVVANLLQTRYQEVQLVTPEGSQHVTLDPTQRDLEAVFVPLVAQAHYQFISESDFPYGHPPPLKPPPQPTILERLKSIDVADLFMAMILGPGVIITSLWIQKNIVSQVMDRLEKRQ